MQPWSPRPCPAGPAAKATRPQRVKRPSAVSREAEEAQKLIEALKAAPPAPRGRMRSKRKAPADADGAGPSKRGRKVQSKMGATLTDLLSLFDANRAAAQAAIEEEDLPAAGDEVVPFECLVMADTAVMCWRMGSLRTYSSSVKKLEWLCKWGYQSAECVGFFETVLKLKLVEMDCNLTAPSGPVVAVRAY